MSDFGNCEAILAEVGDWGGEVPLFGEDIKPQAFEVEKLTPAPELHWEALSNQAQENDTPKSFISEYKKPIIVCVAL